MKYTVKISMSILAAVLLLTSCEKEESSLGFFVDTEEITIGAEGGTEIVKILSDKKWVATTTEPWVLVSPANGRGTVDCQIQIDTTLLANSARYATVRFISDDQPEVSLRVIQTGYEKMILVSETEVDLPSFADRNKRVFDVEVTANVEFDIKFPDTVKWINNKEYSFELDRGSRPRTAKLRFEWENNVRPWDRIAKVSFDPKNEDEVETRLMTVTQTRADKIEDNREGDSLAIVACARSLGYEMHKYDGESMSNWSFVTLWEKTDKDLPDESYIGRVRSLYISSFETEEGVPYEIQFLTKMHDLTLRGNSNAFLKNLSTGEYLSKLTQLKHLSMYSFGLSEMDDSFEALENLETLDLGGNNFGEVPAILTPENFPALRELDLAANRRWTILDMSSSTRPEDEWGGFFGAFPERLLKWDSLYVLNLSNNYLLGKVPDMMDYKKYTDEDIALNDTIPPCFIGTMPKVLPAAKVFRINLNMLDGEVPDWLLYHPNLMDWDPVTLVFNQESYLRNPDGDLPGFTNIPENDEYWYEVFPKKKPKSE